MWHARRQFYCISSDVMFHEDVTKDAWTHEGSDVRRHFSEEVISSSAEGSLCRTVWYHTNRRCVAHTSANSSNAFKRLRRWTVTLSYLLLVCDACPPRPSKPMTVWCVHPNHTLATTPERQGDEEPPPPPLNHSDGNRCFHRNRSKSNYIWSAEIGLMSNHSGRVFGIPSEAHWCLCTAPFHSFLPLQRLCFLWVSLPLASSTHAGAKQRFLR